MPVLFLVELIGHKKPGSHLYDVVGGDLGALGDQATKKIVFKVMDRAALSLYMHGDHGMIGTFDEG